MAGSPGRSTTMRKPPGKGWVVRVSEVGVIPTLSRNCESESGAAGDG